MEIPRFQMKRRSVVVFLIVIGLLWIIKAALDQTGSEGDSGAGLPSYTDCTTAQRERQRHLAENCRTLSASGVLRVPDLEAWRRQAWTVMVLEDQRAVLCLVPKVGSSSWKVKLLTTRLVVDEDMYTGKDTFQPDLPLQEVLNKHGIRSLVSYTLPEVRTILSTYHKVLFSRHPLDRLVSAYRSKMILADGVSPYYTDMAYIIAQGNTSQTGSHQRRRRRLPTLEQFADHVARGRPEEYDVHWRSVVDMCNPCGVEYDYLGRLETMEDDTSCVLDRLGLSSWFPPRPRPSPGGGGEGYMMLPPELLKKLKDIYRLDYELFGYSQD